MCRVGYHLRSGSLGLKIHPGIKENVSKDHPGATPPSEMGPIR